MRYIRGLRAYHLKRDTLYEHKDLANYFDQFNICFKISLIIITLIYNRLIIYPIKTYLTRLTLFLKSIVYPEIYEQLDKLNAVDENEDLEGPISAMGRRSAVVLLPLFDPMVSIWCPYAALWCPCAVMW